ncbi:OLC1v1012793C1 [Oldenlandia corymbosa var. corymbosa]|uniref:OLC1v1012793C1 n=1 Tax=Oldenlandia corymbosa var. corymbosa TaxID=529605 RepID=A0AAV1E059_OLDCO|nr:OLC1v1012793C1 [Oldenlandia corymbosa var. corymbosa]
MVETLVAGCGTQACRNPSSANCDSSLDVAASPPSQPEKLKISVDGHDLPPVVIHQVPPQLAVLESENIQPRKTHDAQTDNRFALLCTIDEADCEDQEEEEEAQIEDVYVGNLESTTSSEVESALQRVASENPLCIGHSSDDGTVGINSEFLESDIGNHACWSEGDMENVLVNDTDKGLFHEDVKVSRNRGPKSKAKKADQLKGVNPRQSPSQIGAVRRELGFDFSFSSENNKIGVFSRHGFMLTLLEDLDQVLHFEVIDALVNGTFYLSAVYAKSTKVNLTSFTPWMNIQDHRFKIWPPSQNSMNAFMNVILKIFRQLVKSLHGGALAKWDGLDFLAVVEQNWDLPLEAFGMLRFSLKLHRLKAKLKEWNNETFGDGFANLKAAEKKVQDLEGVYDTTEVRTRRLKDLVTQGRVAAYDTPVGSLPVSHLAFVDDVIIFPRGLKRSLKELNGFLMDYEIVSGQKHYLPLLQPSLSEEILHFPMVHEQCFMKEDDLLVWQHTPTGVFSVTSAYETLRRRGVEEIWAKIFGILNTFACFNKLLPFPEVIASMGIFCYPAICLFARTMMMEYLIVSLDVILQGLFGDIFHTLMRVQIQGVSSISSLFGRWWSSGGLKLAYGVLRKVIPSIILWELWKQGLFLEDAKPIHASIIHATMEERLTYFPNINSLVFFYFLRGAEPEKVRRSPEGS